MIWRYYQWIFLAGMLGSLTDVGAQGTTLSIPHRVTCQACTLDTTRLFTLGDDAANLLHGSTSLWQDGRKRMYAIEHGLRSLIVWDSLGKKIATVGSSGQGPGEIAGDITSVMFGSADTLLILDRAARLTVFSPSYQFVRLVQMEVTGLDAAALPNGRILVAQQLRTTERAGHPFHIVGPSGRIERSIGGDSVEIRPSSRMDPDLMRFGVAADGKSFWQWEQQRYRLTQWGVDGKRLLVVDLGVPPWYTPPTTRPTGTAPNDEARTGGILTKLRTPPGAGPAGAPSTDPPASRLFFAGTDVAGQVWIFGTSPKSPAGPIMEIIDPTGRQKVFSGQLARGLRLLGHSGRLAWSKESDSLGVPRITVWRLNLIGR